MDIEDSLNIIKQSLSFLKFLINNILKYLENTVTQASDI